MSMSDLDTFERIWPNIAPWLFVPYSEEEYQRLVALLDSLIDRVGEDETHPLASLMQIVGTLIAQYVNEHISELA